MCCFFCCIRYPEVMTILGLFVPIGARNVATENFDSKTPAFEGVLKRDG